LQRLLKVPLSGKYNAKTAAAVRGFQRKHHLPGTGVAAKLTHKALAQEFP
jgi:peptidoglycan hydrolase-like protein with peptidoglycan-binding domain